MESEEPENVGKDMAVGAFEDFDSTSLSRISIMDLLIDAEVLGSIATRSAERTGVGLVVDAEIGFVGTEIVASLALTR